jgi:hypothetical protein
MTKPFYLLTAILLLTNYGFSQLNCKTIINAQGGTDKKCFHKNGKLSTLENWDKQKRSGFIKAYGANGKELFNYDLRTFAGHASVKLSYFPNGQVKKAEYTSAPDGGIQYYHKIHEFDETGRQTGFSDLSWPDGHDHLFITIPDSASIKKTNATKKETQNDKPRFTILKIRNDSGKKMSVLLRKQLEWYRLRKDSLVELEPKQTLTIDSVARPTEFMSSCDLLEPELTPANKKSKYEVILEIPRETETKKTYLWHVIKN